jgi:hypothetical protein
MKLLRAHLSIVCLLPIGLAGCLSTRTQEQPTVSNPIEKFPEKGSWTFTKPDILWVNGLVSRLAARNTTVSKYNTPASKYIWEKLTPDTRQCVETFRLAWPQTTPRPSERNIVPQLEAQFLAKVLPELNTLIEGPLIYSEEFFPMDSLEPDTRLLLGQQPTGDALAHLNRMLLEDAFPDLIAKSVRIIFDPAKKGFALVDYQRYFITFYNNQGQRVSSTDVSAGLRGGGSMHDNHQLDFGYSKQGDGKAGASIGSSFGSIDIKTGVFTWQGTD